MGLVTDREPFVTYNDYSSGGRGRSRCNGSGTRLWREYREVRNSSGERITRVSTITVEIISGVVKHSYVTYTLPSIKR